MRRLRKHIDWLNLRHLVQAVRSERLQIAGEGGGVAGDVDDALRLHRAHGLEQRGVAAFARWVNDNHVGGDAARAPSRDDILCFTRFECGIGNVIARGIRLGIGNRFGDNLDAVDVPRLLGKEERNRADAAVGVDHGFAAGQRGEFECFFVQHFGLRWIDLIERVGGDRKGDAADLVIDRVAAPDRAAFFAENRVRPSAVDIMDNRLDLRIAARETIDERFAERQVVRLRDKDDHHFAARFADARHDVAQRSAVPLLIIRLDAVVFGNLPRGLDNRVNQRISNRAMRHRHDRMAALAVKAKRQAPVLQRDGHLNFIAICPWIAHAERWPRRRSVEAADPRQRVLNDAAFESKLRAC